MSKHDSDESVFSDPFLEYPLEVFIPVSGEDHFCGRVTINHLDNEYAAVVDIVQVESKKIFRHIGMSTGHVEPKEALERGRRDFFDFMQEAIS